MAQKTFAFPNRDVIVAVPARYKGREVVVEEKDIHPTRDPFLRVAINFWVYYWDGNRKVPITSFNPFMQIWIGYQEGEGNQSLFYWDADLLQKVPMAHSKDNFEHRNQNFVNEPSKQLGADFEGFGYAETKNWGPDPNLGWG